MSKNAIGFHGTAETPLSFWLPYIKTELEKKEYRVSIPQLPDAEHPQLDKWLPTALRETYTSDTVIFGRSAGCPLVLSILEQIPVQVKLVVLVAGYITPLHSSEVNDVLSHTYHWKQIREHAKQFMFINSDNDPWGCTDLQGRMMMENLGGTLVVPKGEGHMGSDTYHQPYAEFPLLLKLIEAYD